MAHHAVALRVRGYEYDGLNRRVSSSDGTTITDLYYSSDWQVLSEKIAGNYTKRYVWSPVYVDAMVLRDRDTDSNGTLDERLWVQQDANWNVTALVNGSGNVVERYAYDPYGVRTVYDASYTGRSGGTAYDFQHGFQGMWYDAVSRSNKSRGRTDCWPTLGRWNALDPSGLGPDVNAYRFVNNNPTKFVDPSGLDGTLAGYVGIGLWIAQPIRVHAPYLPITGKNGSVFWPVSFSVLARSDAKNGGWILQHITADLYGTPLEYWEAFRVPAGSNAAELIKPKFERPLVTGTPTTFDRLYQNFGGANARLRERLQEKHCDWYWFSGIPDRPKRPKKGVKKAFWKGELYYVQNAAEKDLPGTFRGPPVPGAGPLPATADKTKFKDVEKWLKDNKAVGPVEHSLTIQIYSDGYAKIVSYVAGVISNNSWKLPKFYE